MGIICMQPARDIGYRQTTNSNTIPNRPRPGCSVYAPISPTEGQVPFVVYHKAPEKRPIHPGWISRPSLQHSIEAIPTSKPRRKPSSQTTLYPNANPSPVSS